jgi:hypothetical protein
LELLHCYRLLELLLQELELLLELEPLLVQELLDEVLQLVLQLELLMPRRLLLLHLLHMFYRLP